MPVNATGPPTNGKKRRRDQSPTLSRPCSGNDRLSPSRRRRPLDVEPASPVDRGRIAPKHRSAAASSPTAGEGQRPAKIPEKSCGLPCHRPGCYVLFLPSVRFPDQKFCSGSCRQALRRVRQREARLRQRRRRGARPLRRPHRGPPQPPRSCRHVLRMPSPENYCFSCPQEPRRKRVGRAFRSPVSLLGIGGVVARFPMADSHARRMSASWPWTNWVSAIDAIACPTPRPRPPWPASLGRYGQQTPVVVCLREETHEVLDGFKRLAAARALGLKTLSTRLLEVDERLAKAAILGLNQTGRRTQEWEEAWIVHALVREDGLTQVEVAELLSPPQELGLPPAGPGREAGRRGPGRPAAGAVVGHCRSVAGAVAGRQPSRRAGDAPPRRADGRRARWRGGSAPGRAGPDRRKSTSWPSRVRPCGKHGRRRAGPGTRGSARPGNRVARRLADVLEAWVAWRPGCAVRAAPA